MKYNLNISHEINGWISVHAVEACRGTTTGYLVVKGMYTSFVTVCVRHYTPRLFCFNRSKFANFITYPLTQTLSLTQPLIITNSWMHSHHHSLTHLHIKCHALAHPPTYAHVLTITYLVDELPLTHTLNRTDIPHRTLNLRLNTKY